MLRLRTIGRAPVGLIFGLALRSKRVKHSFVIAIVALAANQPAIAQVTLSEREQRIVASLQQDVDKRFWLMFPEQKAVVVCPSPIKKLNECKTVRQGSFVVESISLKIPVGKPAVYASKFYFVRFDDGATGYIPYGQRGYFFTEDPKVIAEEAADAIRAAAEKCKVSGEPRLAMTKEEAVATCWGNPKRIVRSRAASPQREYLIYGGGRFLTFENGRLIAIR